MHHSEKELLSWSLSLFIKLAHSACSAGLLFVAFLFSIPLYYPIHLSLLTSSPDYSSRNFSSVIFVRVSAIRLNVLDLSRLPRVWRCRRTTLGVSTRWPTFMRWRARWTRGSSSWRPQRRTGRCVPCPVLRPSPNTFSSSPKRSSTWIRFNNNIMSGMSFKCTYVWKSY